MLILLWIHTLQYTLGSERCSFAAQGLVRLLWLRNLVIFTLWSSGGVSASDLMTVGPVGTLLLGEQQLVT